MARIATLIWIILALALVIIALLFWRKSRKVDRLETQIEQTEKDIQRKQAEAATLRDKAEQLEAQWAADSLNRIASEKAYKSKIQALESSLAGKRKLAETIIQKNDTVRLLVQAYDSLHALQRARINELTDEVRIAALVCRDLTGIQVKELAVIQDIGTDKDKIIEDQAKVIRKLKTGRVLRNVLLPAAVVGSFILGAVAD